jgi:hypothetical protein
VHPVGLYTYSEYNISNCDLQIDFDVSFNDIGFFEFIQLCLFV